MGVKDSFLGRLLNSADKFSEEQVAQTITLLVEYAVKHRATDIHLEPHERFIHIRYRIDGNLKGAHKLPLGALDMVMKELKTLAHMDANETFAVQEGHYTALVDADSFEVRVSIMPVVGGEKAVLHINRRLSEPPKLESIGYWGTGFNTLASTLSRTHGLVLVSAPKRSGKATTLHAAVNLVNTPTVSVATVEDQLEYRLPGVSQTVVRPRVGITFHTALQAALNQDPNIIMITSIPDRATADTAVEAAVSGHLVIAGLHNDNAPSALTHLRSLASEPFLLATAVRACVSQRLVRRLCHHCRQHQQINIAELAELTKAFGITSAATHKRLHELELAAMHANIGSNKQTNTTPGHITGLWRANDDGCKACGRSGYQGSVAITEVLPVTSAIQKGLLEHAPANKLHAIALKEGFVPMGLDGLVKALRGETTVEEVLRITGI